MNTGFKFRSLDATSASLHPSSFSRLELMRTPGLPLVDSPTWVILICQWLVVSRYTNFPSDATQFDPPNLP
ncbi:MAG TPA: hypothetical protein V6D33_01850 [Cyanophyceae cyanobacterium]